MSNFLKDMGYNVPNDYGWKDQVKMLAQLLVISAIVTIPMLVILGIAGWMDQMPGL